MSKFITNRPRCKYRENNLSRIDFTIFVICFKKILLYTQLFLKILPIIINQFNIIKRHIFSLLKKHTISIFKFYCWCFLDLMIKSSIANKNSTKLTCTSMYIRIVGLEFYPVTLNFVIKQIIKISIDF